MIVQVTRYDFAWAEPVSQPEDSLDQEELLELELDVLNQEYELADLFESEDAVD